MSLLQLIQSAMSSLGARQRPTAGLPRAERFNTAGFSCHLGELKDMSATGMKVGCRAQPSFKAGDKLAFRLSSPFQQVQVTARVAWVRRAGRGWNAGFQFVDLVPGMTDALESLARYGFAELEQPGPRRGGSTKIGAEKKPKPILNATVEYEDLYAMLGIGSTAQEDEIHSAFRKLAQRYHPDVNGSPEAAITFGECSKAYAVLHDAEKRRQYDDLILRSRMAA